MKHTYAVLLFLFLSIAVTAQNRAPEYKPDTIKSMVGKFDRTKIRLGKSTLIAYRINNDTRSGISKNTISISEGQYNGKPVYNIRTQNIPPDGDNVTTVDAIVDFNALHLIEMKLVAKTDSGYVKFDNGRFKGWSQLPNEELKSIDFAYEGLVLLSEGNTPWITGLLPLEVNSNYIIPSFHVFSDAVRYKTYQVIGEETVTIDNREYNCWKINSGPQGPPGYMSYQWYDKSSGRIVKVELSKEGKSLKFESLAVIEDE